MSPKITQDLSKMILSNCDGDEGMMEMTGRKKLIQKNSSIISFKTFIQVSIQF